MKQFFLNVLTVFFLMVFPPIGILLMFKCTTWSDGVKKSIAVIWSIIWVAAIWMSVQETAALMQQGM